MTWQTLTPLAATIIVLAVVARGWPRRRADRWRVTFEIERDRSDAERSSDAPGSSQTGDQRSDASEQRAIDE